MKYLCILPLCIAFFSLRLLRAASIAANSGSPVFCCSSPLRGPLAAPRPRPSSAQPQPLLIFNPSLRLQGQATSPSSSAALQQLCYSSAPFCPSSADQTSPVLIRDALLSSSTSFPDPIAPLHSYPLQLSANPSSSVIELPQVSLSDPFRLSAPGGVWGSLNSLPASTSSSLPP